MLQDRARRRVERAKAAKRRTRVGDELEIVLVRAQLGDAVAERVGQPRVVEAGQKCVEQLGLALRRHPELVFDRVGDAAQEVAEPDRRLELGRQQLDPEGKRARDARQQQA